jgi:hypothetical protein
MEEVDTRDRIAHQCVQEAIAVQDMLVPRAPRRNRAQRTLDRIRKALLSQDTASVAEFPTTPSPATILFDPAAAGPPFAQWREPAPQPPAKRKGIPNGRTGSHGHA